MNDNELDFRVGDVVCDIQYGTGKVDSIDNRPFLIKVYFHDKKILASYTADGKYYSSEKHRILYHGTWEQVFGNLPDLRPKRKVKRWVNLYSSEQGIISTPPYSSVEIARKMAIANEVVAVAVEIEVDE